MSVAPPKPTRNSVIAGCENSAGSSPRKFKLSHRSRFVNLGKESEKGTLDESSPCIDLPSGEPPTKSQHLGQDKFDSASPAISGELMTNLRTKSTLQTSASILQGISLTPSEPKSSTSTSLDTAGNTARAMEIEYVDNEVFRLSAQKTRYKCHRDETDTYFQPKLQKFPQNHMSDQIKDPIPLRRGKWTAEEESYATAVIEAFSAGYLDALPGTTLRTFLSEKLQCDPMRITKKFTGDFSIGKKVFHPVARNEATVKIIEETQAHLDTLFEEWRERLESQRQESTRKSLAAEAVSAVSARNGVSHHESSHSSHSLVFEPFPISSGDSVNRVPRDQPISSNTQTIYNIIVRTVSWLEQAESVLSKKSPDMLILNSPSKPPIRHKKRFGQGSFRGDDESSQFISKIELEMEEILRLITEGPAVLSNSQVIPTVLCEAGQTQGGSSQPNRHCPTKSDPRHQDWRSLTITLPIHHSREDKNAWHEIRRAIGKLSPVIEEETCLDSPTCPMKILASLSSQAAPVPIVDDDEEGKEKRMAPSQLTEHDMGNEWKSNKRFKVQRAESTRENENSSLTDANAEDAQTLVNFLHSLVRVKD